MVSIARKVLPETSDSQQNGQKVWFNIHEVSHLRVSAFEQWRFLLDEVRYVSPSVVLIDFPYQDMG